MAEASIQQRWKDYQVSKTALFWCCVACVVATMLVGFVWGGWVTSSSANALASAAADKAQSDLAAKIRVARFLAGPEARQRLASLKKENSWQRDDFVEKGGWATPPGLDRPVASAADLCAERLMTAELPAEPQPAKTGQASTAVQ